jgi:hypothetical protein
MINSMQGSKKEGGVIKEMASGGIASGLNEYEVDDMSERLGDKQLSAKMGDPKTDPRTKQILGGEVARREQTRAAAGVGMASGGILAFASGSEGAIKNPFDKEEKDAPAESKFIDATAKKEAKKEEKKAAPKEPAGIMGQSKEYKQMERDIGPALAERQKISAEEQTLRNALAEETKRTPQSYLQEQQDMLKAAGADPQFFEKARNPLTKRMAELGAGAENKKRIREAQAWATFGSTPGPMLSTALKSYSAYLEQTIEDEEDLAKAQAELNKAMFDIDKSEYLEKAGFAKDAVKAKYDGFNRVTKLSYEVATLSENRNKDILDTREKMATQASKSRTELEQERIRAAARVSGGDGGDKLDAKKIKDADAAFNTANKKALEKVEADKRTFSMMADSPEKEKRLAQVREREKELNAKKMQNRIEYGVKGAAVDEAPKAPPPPTPEDIAFTAKKHGISEEEVKKKLGLK